MFGRIRLPLAIPVLAAGFAQAQTELPFYINVLANDSFESDGAAHDSLSAIAPSEWIATGTATQVEYGAEGQFPTSLSDEGNLHFLAGGPGSPVSSVAQRFTIRSAEHQLDIDTGFTAYEFSGWLGGASTDADHAIAEVVFADSNGVELGSALLGPVTAADRTDQTTLLLQGTYGLVPIGTRQVICTAAMTRVDGNYNNAYCDAFFLRFTIGDPVQGRSWSDMKKIFR